MHVFMYTYFLHLVPPFIPGHYIIMVKHLLEPHLHSVSTAIAKVSWSPPPSCRQVRIMMEGSR